MPARFSIQGRHAFAGVILSLLLVNSADMVDQPLTGADAVLVVSADLTIQAMSPVSPMTHPASIAPGDTGRLAAECLEWIRRYDVWSVAVPSPQAMSQSHDYAGRLAELEAEIRRRPLPPDSFVHEPAEYRVGVRSFEGKLKEKTKLYYLGALSIRYGKLPEAAEDSLSAFLERPALADLTRAEVDEIVFTFYRQFGEGSPVWSYLRAEAWMAVLDWIQDRQKPPADNELRGRQAVQLAISARRLDGDLFRRAARDPHPGRALQTAMRSFSPVVHVDERFDETAKLLADLVATDASRRPRTVLFFLGGVMEAAADLPLIRWIQDQGHTVLLAVNAEAADDRMSLEEANLFLQQGRVREYLGPRVNEIGLLSTGAIGRDINLRRASTSPEFLRAWVQADVIISPRLLELPHRLTKGFYSLRLRTGSRGALLREPVTGLVEYTAPGPTRPPERQRRSPKELRSDA